MGTSDRHCVELRRPSSDTVRIDVDTDDAILPAAEAVGVEIPFGCREGRCSSCTARLIEGSIEYRDPPQALDTDRRDAGFVLLCVASPRSTCTIEVGEHVREAAFPSLWKGDE